MKIIIMIINLNIDQNIISTFGLIWPEPCVWFGNMSTDRTEGDLPHKVESVDRCQQSAR